MSFTASMVTGDGTITAVVDGNSYTVDKHHLNYLSIVKAFKEGNSERFVELTNPASQIEEYLGADLPDVNDTVGSIELRHGVIYYGDSVLENTLVDRIYEMMRQGYSFKYMLYFLNNLMMNPSYHSVSQLYKFLEHKHMPITADGYFLAYKTVCTYHGEEFVDCHGKTVRDGDLVDKYTRKVRNNVGDTPNMPRNQVNDDPKTHCSRGYHAGALSYAGPGGWYNSDSDTVILVKIHPADAVAVPDDVNFTKLRTCKYEVVEIYRGPLTNPVYDTDGDDLYDDEVEHDEWYDEDEEENEVFDYEPVTVDDLQIGDVIRLEYVDRFGVSKQRHVSIIDEDFNSFEVELLEDDPSYDDEVSTQVRRFKFSGMYDIKRY